MHKNGDGTMTSNQQDSEGLHLPPHSIFFDDKTESLATEPYSSEWFTHQYHLSRTDFQQEMKNIIDESHLSKKAKTVWKGTINDFYDKTVFLSYQNDVNAAIIDLEITMIMMRIACKRTDILLPEFPHLEELTRTHLAFILTRTVGKDRERILESRQAIEHRQMIVPGEQERVEGKKGVLSKIFRR